MCWWSLAVLGWVCINYSFNILKTLVQSVLKALRRDLAVCNGTPQVRGRALLKPNGAPVILSVLPQITLLERHLVTTLVIRITGERNTINHLTSVKESIQGILNFYNLIFQLKQKQTIKRYIKRSSQTVFETLFWFITLLHYSFSMVHISLKCTTQSIICGCWWNENLWVKLYATCVILQNSRNNKTSRASTREETASARESRTERTCFSIPLVLVIQSLRARSLSFTYTSHFESSVKAYQT